MDNLCKIFEVDLSFDVTLSKNFVIAPWVTITIAVSINLEIASQEEISLVLPNLLLQSVE